MRAGRTDADRTPECFFGGRTRKKYLAVFCLIDYFSGVPKLPTETHARPQKPHTDRAGGRVLACTVDGMVLYMQQAGRDGSSLCSSGHTPLAVVVIHAGTRPPSTLGDLFPPTAPQQTLHMDRHKMRYKAVKWALNIMGSGYPRQLLPPTPHCQPNRRHRPAVQHLRGSEVSR